METINTVSYEDIISEIYDDNLSDIRNGIYGRFIEDKGSGIYVIDDGTRHVDMKIEGNDVVFCNTYTTYPCKWVEALPIISIKDRRYEQLYFENRTQMGDVDGIFLSPNYFNIAKGRTAEIIYMTPIEYMELCVTGFGNTTLQEELNAISKDRVEKFAVDMLKGDLFPMIMIEHYKGDFYQEGRHRAMAIQYLIDNDEIPKDTEIPVVIVSEV